MMRRSTGLLGGMALAAWLGGVPGPAPRAADDAAPVDAPLPVLAEPRDGDRIYFVGDSITQHGAWTYGYVTQVRLAVRGAYPTRDITIRASGVGFNDAQDVRKRLKTDVLSSSPTIVVVEIGLADLYYSEKRPIDLKMFLFAMKDIIWQIRRAGARPVLMTLTVIGEHTDGSNPEDAVIEAYSQAIRDLARAKRCPLIDVRPALMDFLKRVNPDNLQSGVLTPAGDGVHLNPDGNQLLANLVLEAFQVPTPQDWRDTLAARIRQRLASGTQAKVIAP